MQQLLQDLVAIIEPILNRIWGAMRGGMLWLWGVIVAAVVVPAQAVLTALEGVTTYVELLILNIDGQISHLHLADVPVWWATASYYVGVGDAWVPAILAVEIGIALGGLWVVCAGIRAVIAVIDTVKP